MERRDNYAIQAGLARQLFLNYNQEKLIAKLHLKADDDYLYTVMFSEPYRIHRRTAEISRYHNGQWVDGNSFSEDLTLLDWMCDSREDRYLRCRWKNLTAFGMQFHQALTEERSPLAESYERNADALRQACLSLGGKPFPQGDLAYEIELFDGLCIVLQLWFGDEDFPAQIRWLWDENALMYIKYETMYYAIGLLQTRLKERMEEAKCV